MTALTHQGPGAEPVLFDAELHPSRSLGPQGMAIAIAALAFSSLVIGIVFLAQGAWPVLGYCGLDVALLWWALRRARIASLIYEKIRLTQARVVVERGDHRGPRRRDELQTYWLKLEIDRRRHDPTIRLKSHGRSLVVGSFLSPPERLGLAAALDKAIAQAKAPPLPAAQSA